MRIQRGFTYIEILTVLAVMSIVAAISLVTFSNLRSYQALRVAVQDVQTTFIDAQNLTLAAKEDMVYGIHIEEAQVVRFSGGTYSAADPDNVYVAFTPPVTATTSLTGGAIDIVFARLSGEADVSGTITLVDGNTNASSTLTVYNSGLIEL